MPSRMLGQSSMKCSSWCSQVTDFGKGSLTGSLQFSLKTPYLWKINLTGFYQFARPTYIPWQRLNTRVTSFCCQQNAAYSGFFFVPSSRHLSDMHVWCSLLSMKLFHTTLLILLNPLKCRTLTYSRIMTYIYIYICRTAPLTSKRCTLYIYSTNIRTKYFKHAAHSQFFLFKMPFIS
jgi:hypothetical protein